VTQDRCPCATFKSIGLPCRHIFAIRAYCDMPMFCPDVVPERWTRTFNSNHIPQFTTTPSKVSVVQTPQKKVLGVSEKYKKTLIVTQKITTIVSNMGMDRYSYYHYIYTSVLFIMNFICVQNFICIYV
jgi:hypothetical protein